MKSLQEYIFESANSKEFRFYLNKFKDTEIDKSLKSLAEKNKIYAEIIDNGIKIRLTKDNYKNADSIIDLMTEFANSFSTKDEYAAETEKIEDTITSMQEFINSFNDEGE